MMFLHILFKEPQIAGADLEGGAPGARPPVRPYMLDQKINLRPPVQPDNLYCCAPRFNIFWIRAWIGANI